MNVISVISAVMWVMGWMGLGTSAASCYFWGSAWTEFMSTDADQGGNWKYSSASFFIRSLFSLLLIFEGMLHICCVHAWMQRTASKVNVNVWLRLWTWWLERELDLVSPCLPAGVAHMSKKPVGRDGPLWFACICCTLGVHFSLRGEHGSTKCQALWRTHLVSGDNISDWWGHLCLYCVCFSVTGGVTGEWGCSWAVVCAGLCLKRGHVELN